MARVPTWDLPKHGRMTHRNPILMHSFHSMPRLGIQQVSLKAYRRWDSTCDRMMVIDRINELSTPLDLGRQDSATGAPLIWSMDKGSFFWSILETRVLLSK